MLSARVARDRVADVAAERVGPIGGREAVSDSVVHFIQRKNTDRPERSRSGPGVAFAAMRWERGLVGANPQKVTETLFRRGPAQTETLATQGVECSTKGVVL